MKRRDKDNVMERWKADLRAENQGMIVLMLTVAVPIAVAVLFGPIGVAVLVGGAFLLTLLL